MCSTYHTENAEITCLFRELIKTDLLIKDQNCYFIQMANGHVRKCKQNYNEVSLQNGQNDHD